jgi:hypothetical protein
VERIVRVKEATAIVYDIPKDIHRELDGDVLLCVDLFEMINHSSSAQ